MEKRPQIFSYANPFDSEAFARRHSLSSSSAPSLERDPSVTGAVCDTRCQPSRSKAPDGTVWNRAISPCCPPLLCHALCYAWPPYCNGGPLGTVGFARSQVASAAWALAPHFSYVAKGTSKTQLVPCCPNPSPERRCLRTHLRPVTPSIADTSSEEDDDAPAFTHATRVNQAGYTVRVDFDCYKADTSRPGYMEHDRSVHPPESNPEAMD